MAADSPPRPPSLREGGGAFAGIDPAGLVAFRVLFGTLVAVAAARFVVSGWVAEHFLEPKHFFTYWGFEWIRPLPGPWMYALYGVLFVSALAVAAGAFYRVACALVFVTFTYAHLCDKTHYLNHYYLVSILAVLLACVPLHRASSVDAWRATRRGDPSFELTAFPAWYAWLFRFQIGCVYFFAGVAKLQTDWLVHAQPLTVWLSRSTDIPIVGPLLSMKATAYVMSVIGAAFDLSVPFLLSYRRTRPFAYAALLGFHVMTARLFQLGMFPYLMPSFATVFFDPSWPRRLVATVRRRSVELPVLEARSSARWPLVLAAAHAVVQILMPLRHFLYPGNVLWTEEGIRYSWKVMLVEKNGSVDLWAQDRHTGERFLVSPRDYLVAEQTRMMSTQPDMILELAHMVRDDFRARGRDVAVFVHADVSLNGRPSAPFVDPKVDLGAEEEGLGPKRWILPMPQDPPRF
ncbi:MAG: HTTM domain-containing protein [Polyangiaceae bacterium]|nr:HTTM domain-containing protein [Polyangiaceae bacterium]